MRIETIGQIWKSEANGYVYWWGGYPRPYALVLTLELNLKY